MSNRRNHGGEEDLAPVIPLFGAPTNTWVHDQNPASSTDDAGWWVDPDDELYGDDELHEDDAAFYDDGREASADCPQHPSPDAEPFEAGEGITLMRAADLAKAPSDRSPGVTIHATTGAGAPVAASAAAVPAQPVRLRIVQSDQSRAGRDDDEAEPAELSDDEMRELAERRLLKKLRGRGLSIAEARTLLRGLDCSTDIQNQVIDEFVSRSYLDDAVLAEQIVHAGLSRKGQGRRAIALALAQRGIDRSVIDDALADLPDDDAERALEFARTKARSMARLEPDVALRRLMGQLARRGFGGSVAREAAGTALREVSGPRFR